MTSVAEVWNCPTVQGVVNQPVLQCRARERHRLGLPSLRMFLMNWGRWAQTRVTWILAIKRILLRLRLRWEMTGMMEVILVSRRSLDRPLHGRSMRSLDEKLDEYNSFFLVRSQPQVHLNSLDKMMNSKAKGKKEKYNLNHRSTGRESRSAIFPRYVAFFSPRVWSCLSF